jgi:hypothetical protein
MRSQRLLYWFFYCALLPLLFVGTAWLLLVRWGHTQAEKAYLEIFGTGDLLLIAVLLLFSVAGDIKIAGQEKKLGVWMIANELVFYAVSFFVLVSYGGMRIAYVLQKEDVLTLHQNANFSWSIVAYSLAHTFLVKYLLDLAED